MFPAPEPIITSPDSIQLGVPASIRCEGGTGGAPNEVIKWVNASAMGDLVSMAINAAELDLELSPASLSANNTEYSCVISNHITSTITIRVQGRLVDIVVVVVLAVVVVLLLLLLLFQLLLLSLVL